MQIILFINACALCAGVYLGFSVFPSWRVWLVIIGLASVSIAAIFFSYRKNLFIASDLLIIVSFFLVGSLVGSQENIYVQRLQHYISSKKSTLTVAGVVDPQPATLHGQCFLSRPALVLGRAVLSLPFPVSVRYYTEKSVRIGEKYIFTGRLSSRIAPGIFVGRMTAREIDGPLPKTLRERGEGAMLVFRDTLRKKVAAHLSPVPNAFFSAFFFGNRESLGHELKRAFSRTGTYHILSISGLHLGIFYFFVLYALRILRLSYSARIICAVCVSGLYCLMTGNAIPTQRSLFAIVLFAATFFVKRRVHPLQTLGIILIVILLATPGVLFQLSFWLSFLSVFFIISGFAVIPFKQQPRPLEALFYTSLFAFLATAPLTVKYFNNLPILGVFINMLIVPLSSLILFTGVLSIVFLGLPLIASMMFLTLDFLIRISVLLVASSEKIASLSINGAFIPGYAIAFYYGAAIGGVCYWILKKPRV